MQYLGKFFNKKYPFLFERSIIITLIVVGVVLVLMALRAV